MSNSLQPISPVAHKTHGYSRNKNYLFSKNDSISAVVLDEISSLLPIYALAFVKDQRDRFALVALQGLYKDENIFIDDNGRWTAGYIPRSYRSYPVTMADAVINDEQKSILCFDMNSGLYCEKPNLDDGEERFFDDDGKPQPLMGELISFLTQTNHSKKLTEKAVDTIEETDILEPWNLEVENKDPDRELIKGLYRINQKKLDALEADKLKALQKSNGLSVAYAQLFSMKRIDVLKNISDLKNKKQQKEQEKEINLDEFFGEANNDSLNFNF